MSYCHQGPANDGCYEVQNFCKINGQKVKDNLSINARSLSSITASTTIFTKDIQNRIYTVLKNIYNYGDRGTRNPEITEEGSDTYLNLSEAYSYEQRESDITINLQNNGVSSFEFWNARDGQPLYLTITGRNDEVMIQATPGGRCSFSYANTKVTKIRITRWNSWQDHQAIHGEFSFHYEGNYKFSNVNKGDEILQSLYNQVVDFISTDETISNQPIIKKELMDKLQPIIDEYEINNDRCNTCNTDCNGSCQASWQCGCCDDGQQHCEGQYGGGGGFVTPSCTPDVEFHGGCWGSLYYRF